METCKETTIPKQTLMLCTDVIEQEKQFVEVILVY
jgi:hypothetical protein